MTLLIDTDALVVLLGLGLLDEAVEALDFTTDDVRVLPAARYQLRKGRRYWARWPLVDRNAAADRVERFKEIKQTSDYQVADQLARVDAIDTGEVQLFALAATTEAIVATGDKRALRALLRTESLTSVAKSCQGKIITLDQIIGKLVDHVGLEDVQSSFRQSQSDHPSLRMLLGHRGDCGIESFRDALASMCREFSDLSIVVKNN